MSTPRHILFITLMLTVLSAFGAPSFTVSPPRRVFEGDKFSVTYRLNNGEGTNLRVSPINGCTLLFGPSTSTSRSYSVVNGHMESSSRVEYTYTYRADRAGEFTIPAASITVDGKTLTSREAKFTVEPSSQRNTPATQRPTSIDDADTQSTGRKVDPNDIFVRIILSRPTVWEQEAIECTIKLYTAYSITQFLPTRQPAFDGFLVRELDIQAALNQEETLNGRTYLTAVLKKCIIFPQKSGRLTINSGNYDVTLVQYENINMGGIMTVRQPVERSIKVSSNTATVNVKPLPSPAPAGFTGAVGQFSAESRLVGNSFRTNDPATLIYTINGTGNIDYLKEPAIDFPDEFEQYTPQADIKTSVQGGRVSGTMTVEYTFVPQTPGNFTIGAHKFVYFDPSRGEYVTIDTPSYNIKVSQGASGAGTTKREDISAKNTDIRHIRTGGTSLGTDHTPIARHAWYWLLYVGALAVVAGVVIGYRRKLQLDADVAGRRLAHAGKVAKKRLAVAKRYLNERNADAFYEETLRALRGYLSDKLGIGGAEMSAETIDSRLADAGADEQLRSNTAELISECEMARYTPDSSSHIDEVFSRTESLINQLENLKKGKK